MIITIAFVLLVPLTVFAEMDAECAELPHRYDQIQCYYTKVNNNSQELRDVNYQEISLKEDYPRTWRDSQNMDVLIHILGSETFEKIEPVFSIDSIVLQRQGEYRIETSYAIEQGERVREKLQNYADKKFPQMIEIKKNFISEMDLTTQEKVDLIYNTKTNLEGGWEGAKTRNDIFVDQMIAFYYDLDRRDENARKNQLWLEEQNRLEEEVNRQEQEEKEKIRQELESAETVIASCGTGTIEKNGQCVPDIKSSKGGGCLIATATYGSELTPQVQQLRELRDNQLLHTESGTSFINTFNDFYYSFSPIIADYERENPIFKEMVKIGITPMISSLSILNYVDMDSEIEVLGYGISLIVLNGMMYVGIPVSAIVIVRRFYTFQHT